MVEPGEVLIAMSAFTAVAVVVITVSKSVLRYQENKLRYEHQALDQTTVARIERMEHAVDAIAIEIERISEGQRFTTKLLSERERPRSIS